MLAVTAQSTMPSQKPRLLVIIDSDLKRDFEALCELEDRSMSNKAVNLIRQAVEQAKREGRLSDRSAKDKKS